MAQALRPFLFSSKVYVNVELKGKSSTGKSQALAPKSHDCLVVAQTQGDSPSFSANRRAVALAGLAAASSLLPVRKADALFGIGGQSKMERYTAETNAAIKEIQDTIALPRTDPSRDEAIAHLKVTANAWVARYRRDKEISGKPSYGLVYSAVNAVEGHYNNFGSKAPIPKKRADRIIKELSDAELAVSRGR